MTYSTPTRFINDVAVANPTILDDGTYRYIWAGGTFLYAVNKTDSSYLVSHSDGQGTLLSQTDGAGQVVTIYANDVSGQVEADDGGYGYAEPEVFPIRYAGEQYDAESDLIYLRARYMDPLSGRFMSRDTFGGYATNPQSKNRYAYAGNNPANRVDPSGYIACIDTPPTIAQCVATAAAAFLGGAFIPGAILAFPYVAIVGLGVFYANGEGGIDHIPDEAYGRWAQVGSQRWQGNEGYGQVDPKTGKTRDGEVFHNDEGLLPPKPEGTYREYDIRPIPKSGNRGRERIVVDTQTGEAWYTDEHYGKFVPMDWNTPRPVPNPGPQR